MLADAKVGTAKQRPKSYKLFDANRLFLLVAPGGGKLWRWNYTYDGKNKTMAFGAYGIDVPELPGHCRSGRSCTPGDPYASTSNLRRLATRPLQCRAIDRDAYGRTVARCVAAGRDLSCAQVEGRFAVRRYGSLSC